MTTLTAEPVVVHGRNRYADTALTRVTITDVYRKDLVVIEGGYIEPRHGTTFAIAAKHPTATDEEHDSSYVAMIEGAGLTWTWMLANTHTFTGVLLEARYYREDPAMEEVCDEDCPSGPFHGFLPFTPPQVRITPGVYEIHVEHLTGAEEEA